MKFMQNAPQKTNQAQQKHEIKKDNYSMEGSSSLNEEGPAMCFYSSSEEDNDSDQI